jgi:biopolymer transport protein ExbD
MQFTTHRRRNPPAVIIVSLIDVLMVVLIFLMVTTTFKQQPALKVSLPESTQSTRAGASEDAPLYVTINASGNFFLGQEKQPVTGERLAQELKNRAGTNPKLKVTINSDKQAPFGQFVKVMDATRAANIPGVNIRTLESAKP